MQYKPNSTDQILKGFDPYIGKVFSKAVKIVVFDQFVFIYLVMIEKASRNTSATSNFW